ncbi:Prolyl 4-hydroxylase subunit alpha [Pseudomonas savastanoi]|uniref:Prolyl 4-hydroxylase subunit alpha n=2 Tax=Pseudomonas syringae group TaxID=136849 RepID=A0A0P9MSN4_PSESX|nr:Prolyl 4-hydroxylase subunit alpha [Pseudomonas syringae pv. castaneae]RMS86830.1 Prolyl 4-hydroxylase subunit alpha [Pseudomonas savastanoi]SPF21136.1 prolyl 4-hydroxylase subunit alpha [Pseudomonas syringae group genomosp. 3]
MRQVQSNMCYGLDRSIKMTIGASNIMIYDGIVPPDLTAQLGSLARKPIWQYGWRSNVESDNYFFWHSHFAGGDTNSDTDSAHALANRQGLQSVSALWEHIETSIGAPQKLLRAYANGHTYGTEGYAHKDSKREDYLSAIYFAHDEWQQDWGGELLFYADSGEIIKSVAPLPGRIVVFPGCILHRASSLSRICPLLRVSFVFKSSPR